jgi:hypothetical protein
MVSMDRVTIEGPTGSWLMRKLLKRSSSFQLTRKKQPRKASMKHKRSFSDISVRRHKARDHSNNKDLGSLVRLCGLSVLSLPADYAPQSLGIPTCLRATAQYLVHHG